MQRRTCEDISPGSGIPEQAVQHTLAANPLIGVRSEDILDAMRMLLGQTLRSPGVAAEQFHRRFERNRSLVRQELKG